MHSKKSRNAIFREEKAPAGCSLLIQDLSTQKYWPNPLNMWLYMFTNSQECCFYWGKSPCGMHSADQGLVKLNSGKIRFKILYIHCKPYHFLYRLGVLGIRGVSGNYKKSKILVKGVVVDYIAYGYNLWYTIRISSNMSGNLRHLTN